MPWQGIKNGFVNLPHSESISPCSLLISPHVKQAYTNANDVLCNIVKVTPSSKVVGHLAQFMVINKMSTEELIEKSSELNLLTLVVEFLQGQLCQPKLSMQCRTLGVGLRVCWMHQCLSGDGKPLVITNSPVQGSAHE
eukprot:2462364-Rhodomonas_salina.1